MEFLVAITIFSIGLLAIAGLQITSIQHNARANTQSSTTALARGILENILSRAGDDALFDADTDPAQPWDFDPATLDPDPTTTVEGGGTYSASFRILAGNPAAGMARVEVTVNGPNRRTLTLTGFKRAI
ncbi:hypothetical protein DESUT3_03850 [Desulfuromonas versatilis]|uniref:Type IV pilus assembly protein PilV n=1 Tax=Desulfuromonas versatilis TaxID=2802975 RepID=A0ABN6DT29_9BACT|nr:hypothetical protein DESUT3_03850 [Desulfuromonas versatilis]